MHDNFVSPKQNLSRPPQEKGGKRKKRRLRGKNRAAHHQ
jgi:hypothetical protein